MALLDRLRSRRPTAAAAHALYAQAIRQARAPSFYAGLGVPDTLDGRFDLLVLHVFLLLHRLKREGKATQQVSQALFDLMFRDMDRSLRELGVSDHSIGKRVKQMLAAFYGRLRAYEEALAEPARLAEALRRNVYREAGAEAAAPLRLAAYVEAEVARLAGLSRDALLCGEAGFAHPDFTQKGQEIR
jgi:cytochrome b pre-mRNA-processing protein 3